MAREYSEFRRRGGSIATVVIDPPAANAAMAEKLALPFPILSDHDGGAAIKPYDVWDDGESMARPAILVLAPDGRETYRYVGVDYMDRPDDGEVLNALEALGLPPLPAIESTVAHLPAEPGPRAYTLERLFWYMRGIHFAMKAFTNRARDPWHREEARRTAAMAERYMSATRATQAINGTR